ncbi:hypothetical protein [Paraburkholderia bryophila]|uniref:Uncharacterized protein n=1 Tax=Paraburkholderia bryophila TaxID=420952 RepID=A0A329B5V4_9BURK|nr:hypothetical protein [Paraburkholderia bryophila]RAS17044.1 hypothetical protein BX591_15017 [Paraburkholderia bryophila]
MTKIYGIVVDANTTFDAFNKKTFDLKRADADVIAIISIAPDDASQMPDFAKWKRSAYAKKEAQVLQVVNLQDPALGGISIVG